MRTQKIELVKKSPNGMSWCYMISTNGGCGLDCPVYLQGDCKNPSEVSGSKCCKKA